MKNTIKLFFKSVIVGLGGISPGLSGSVLMIIFGIYQDALEALGTLFKDFKRKIKFLLPMGAGIVVGLLLFSKVLNFLLTTFEMPTRFTFLGLIAGTVPLFYRQMTKNGFGKKYIFFIVAAFVAGTMLFTLNRTPFPQVTDPNFLQKIGLGIAVAASAIIPGADSVVLLSTLGLYELYLSVMASPLANLDILPLMAVGVAIGGISVSFLMTQLFKHFYTATFSVIFGVFLAMIPNIFNESCYLACDWQTAISLVLLASGFLVSLYMGKIGNKQETN